ncbi:MAG: HlyD family secretion protein, partial [Bacteroidaceae bacterium]
YLYNTIVILCIVCGAVYAASQFMYFGGGEVTDNARVCQNIVPQNCRVQDFIREVRFAEFQEVKKGDTLVIIEDAEFRLRLAQAEADLTRAEHGTMGTASSINTTKTSISVTDASIEEARVQMENAAREDTRFQRLLQQDAVTQQQYENVHTGYLSAKAGYEQALRSRNTQMAVVAEQGHHLSVSKAAIEVARAQVDLARLNLSYCYIIATCDGVAGSKDIHEGQLVNPGQTMVSIVDRNEKWVEANYQESQMPNVKVGDKVRFTADAVPGVEYTGMVERIADATGSAFSLIPIDNATGNFVKVEQRVTVRVRIDACEELEKLHGGYNVVCKIAE